MYAQEWDERHPSGPNPRRPPPELRELRGENGVLADAGGKKYRFFVCEVQGLGYPKPIEGARDRANVA